MSRYSNLCCKMAEIDLSKRAGELTEDEVKRLVTVIQNPEQFKVPRWFLNRQKDVKDGKWSQAVSNGLDNKLREDLERCVGWRCSACCVCGRWRVLAGRVRVLAGCSGCGRCADARGLNARARRACT